MKKITYKKSGVDIDQANIFVDKIKALLRKTRRKEVFSSVGGMGGLETQQGLPEAASEAAAYLAETA